MSKLEKAIVSMLEVFEEYAGTDDNKKSLSNAELKTLIQNQLSSPEFQAKVDQEDVREALDKMDKDKDGQVNFKEFTESMSRLAQGYYKKKFCKGQK
ncbi:protein S100-B-like [Trichomycterus rosablanca]|uniref:protein S100-B-like n=1 Tax=Trichomycterus rosablanca TaxID=2290929 RepID=UPI002F3540CA